MCDFWKVVEDIIDEFVKWFDGAIDNNENESDEFVEIINSKECIENDSTI